MKMRRQHSISADENPIRVKTSVIPVMLGGHSGLDPPLPISNRAVKRTSANDSMLLACESRSLPSYLYLNTPHENDGVFLFVLHQYPQLMNTSFELMIQGGFFNSELDTGESV